MAPLSSAFQQSISLHQRAVHHQATSMLLSIRAPSTGPGDSSTQTPAKLDTALIVAIIAAVIAFMTLVVAVVFGYYSHKVARKEHRSIQAREKLWKRLKCWRR